jgi:hypothetical protein
MFYVFQMILSEEVMLLLPPCFFAFLFHREQTFPLHRCLEFTMITSGKKFTCLFHISIPPISILFESFLVCLLLNIQRNLKFMNLFYFLNTFTWNKIDEFLKGIRGNSVKFMPAVFLSTFAQLLLIIVRHKLQNKLRSQQD